MLVTMPTSRAIQDGVSQCRGLQTPQETEQGCSPRGLGGNSAVIGEFAAGDLIALLGGTESCSPVAYLRSGLETSRVSGPVTCR